MCNMDVIEDTPHVILYCPYLDGACQYALLLWSKSKNHLIFNLFSSALKTWPCNKVIMLILDPSSQLSTSTLRAHNNDLLLNTIKFAQDYIFSITRQRSNFYGDNP